MSLPADVRRHVALWPLESLEVEDDESVSDAWTAEISSRVDDIRSGKVETILGEQVFAELAAQRASRHAQL